MINRRYRYNGKPIIKLNPMQKRIKKQIDDKIISNVYKFEKTSCPVCTGIDFELLSEKDRYGLYLPVVICKTCGLIQSNPHMNQMAYANFYNEEYRKLYVGEMNPTEAFFSSQYRKGRRIYNYLQKNQLLLNPNHTFVFEVGCGAGGILKYFKDQGCKVKGVDLGERYIDYGIKEKQLDLSVGTIRDVVLNEAPDLIIYSHVLEHILNPNEELKTVYEILSESGLLYIEIPGVKNINNRYNFDFLKLLQNAHINHFTLTTLKNLVSSNGFELMLGNEFVNSVFLKSQETQKRNKIDNDYLPVLRYLKRAEMLRIINLVFSIKRLRRVTRFIKKIVNSSNKVGK